MRRRYSGSEDGGAGLTPSCCIWPKMYWSMRLPDASRGVAMLSTAAFTRCAAEYVWYAFRRASAAANLARPSGGYTGQYRSAAQTIAATGAHSTTATQLLHSIRLSCPGFAHSTMRQKCRERDTVYAVAAKTVPGRPANPPGIQSI